MKTLSILAYFVLFSGAVYSQSVGDSVHTEAYWNEVFCRNVNSQDCKTKAVELQCGTDGVTYQNGCELAQSYCAKDTHKYHDGPCTNDTSVTRSPEEVKHGSDLVYEVECLRLSHETCLPKVGEILCGTDGYTYPNYCEFSKGRCQHRNLHVSHTGTCTS